MHLGLVSLLCALLLDAPLPSEIRLNTLTLRPLSQVGGEQITGRCHYRDGILYIANGFGLMVIDARDVANIKLIRRFPSSSPNADGCIVAVGDYLYVGIGQELKTFDISKPATPELLHTASLGSSRSVFEIQLYDNRLLISTGDTSQIFPHGPSYEAVLANPRAPSVSQLGIGPLWADGDLLCVTIDNYILRVLNWKTRQLITQFEPKVPYPPPSPIPSGYQPLKRIFVKDNFIFVRLISAGFTFELVGNNLVERQIASVGVDIYEPRYDLKGDRLWMTSFGSPKTVVVDYKDPTAPQLVSVMNFYTAYIGDEIGVGHRGSTTSREAFIFDAKTFQTIAPLHDFHLSELLLLDGDQILTGGLGSGSLSPPISWLSLKDPENPQFEERWSVAGRARPVHVTEDRLFVLESQNTNVLLSVFDRAGTNRAPLASLLISPLNNITFENERLFYWVRDPATRVLSLVFRDHDLKESGRYLAPSNYSSLQPAAAFGNVFFTLAELWAGQEWLAVDLSDLAKPKILAQHSSAFWVREFANIDGNLFVLSYDGIQVYDPLDATMKTVVSSNNFGHSANGYNFRTKTSDFLAIYHSGGVRFMDYTDPRNPATLGNTTNRFLTSGTGIYRKPFLYWSVFGTLHTYAVIPDFELTYSRHAEQLHFYMPKFEDLEISTAVRGGTWTTLPSTNKHSIEFDVPKRFFRSRLPF